MTSGEAGLVAVILGFLAVGCVLRGAWTGNEFWLVPAVLFILACLGFAASGGYPSNLAY